MGDILKSRTAAVAAGLMLAGLLLRLAAFDAYTAYWPDETHQYLEQAHRLLTGVGLVPWEYVDGLRSRLLPLLLMGPMAIGHPVAGAWGGIVAARAMVFAVALAMMPAAYAIGRRVSPAHGLAALGAAALWFEIVVWSAHVLSETLSITAFLVAAALMLRRERWAVAGACLAFAVLMRVQHGPALALFALLVARGDGRAWRGLVMGALPVLAAGGAVDMAFGQWPFEWVWQNYAHTIAGGRGAAFGEQPWWWYLQAMWANWLVALPLLAIGVFKAPAAMRPLLWTAIANVAVHMAIGHKEYRYIALSMTIFAIVGAMGWVSFFETTGLKCVAAPLAIAGMAALSLMLAWRGPDEWDSIRGSTMPRLQALAANDARTCGIAFVGPGVWAPSRHVMDRDVPLYLFHKDKAGDVAGPSAGAYNRIVAPPGFAQAGYAATGECNGEGADRVCLFARTGGCVITSAAAPYEIQRYRRERGL